MNRSLRRKLSSNKYKGKIKRMVADNNESKDKLKQQLMQQYSETAQRIVQLGVEDFLSKARLIEIQNQLTRLNQAESQEEKSNEPSESIQEANPVAPDAV